MIQSSSSVVKTVVDSLGSAIVPRDTVIEDLKVIVDKQNIKHGDLSTAMAIYILGFESYNGFS